jgi:hypothetical protein
MARKRFNTKRRVHTQPPDTAMLRVFAKRLRYGGNPEHKRNPGDFGLTPASAPGPDSTLCEEANIFNKEKALALLRQGVLRGMISEQTRGDGIPQNIWAVVDGIPLEAALENEVLAQYHGYPISIGDPLGPEILRLWKERDEQSVPH